MEENTEMFLVCFGIIIIAFTVYIIWKNKMFRKKPGVLSLVRSDSVLCFEIIGAGNFGSVHRGEMVQNNVKVPIALKFASQRCLFTEEKILSQLGHENVVSIYGACELENGQALMIEFCPLGDLANLINQKQLTISGKDDFVTF